MTYYELLQVAPNASHEVIQASYRALIKQAHPDKGGDPKLAQALNEAHSVLSDPQKRAKYDAHCFPRDRRYEHSPYAPGYNAPPPQNPFTGYAQQQPYPSPQGYAQQPPQTPNPAHNGLGFPAQRINDLIQRRTLQFLERIADHFENQAAEALDLDPGQGTLYEMPSPPRRKRRA